MSYIAGNILTLEPFQKVGNLTNIDIPVEVLNGLPCGLFRCDLNQAYDLLPELSSLYDSAPIQGEQSEWEIDVKIHMLMPGQWPCIPNWHCDYVPRGENGITDYQLAKQRVAEGAPPMLLWVSGTPCTQFLSRRVTMPYVPQNHSGIADFIHQLCQKEDMHDDRPLLTSIDPQQWVSMSSLTPHRGMVSDKHQWRIFARLTHKSIAPVRSQTSSIRRHCQVYLDASEFSW